MKKEYLILAQFASIAGFVTAFFGLAMFFGFIVVFDEVDYGLLICWQFSFVVFSLIRFGIYYLIFRRRVVNPNRSRLRDFFVEVSKTFQYFIVAVLATFAVVGLWLYGLHCDGCPYDYIRILFAVEYFFNGWLFTFTVLILIRLAVVAVTSLVSYKKHLNSQKAC